MFKHRKYVINFLILKVVFLANEVLYKKFYPIFLTFFRRKSYFFRLHYQFGDTLYNCHLLTILDFSFR